MLVETSNAEETNQTLLIDCNDESQMQCLSQELESISGERQICLEGQSTVSFDLTTLAKQKFQASNSNSSAMTNALRVAWVNTLQESCKSATASESSNQTSPTQNADKEQLYVSPSNFSWTNQFMAGFTLQSDYNEEKEHLGLEKKSAFAQFAFNGRILTQSQRAIHWEVGGLFSSSPLNDGANETPMPTNGEELSANASMNIQSSGPSNADSNDESPSFNDVSDSLDIYSKLTTSLSLDDNSVSDYFNYGLMVGFKTRGTKTDQNDSVVYYGGPIIEYLYYGSDMKFNESGFMSANKIPRGRVSIAYLNFEEYGGVGHENRVLLTGEWQLNAAEKADSNDGRFVVGFKANLGKGADDVGVFFAYRSGIDAIKTFFTGP